MKSKDQSRFSLVLDRARRALDEPNDRLKARPAGVRRIFEDRRAAPPPLGDRLDPFAQMGAGEPHRVIDPTTLALVDRLRAVGRELSRMEPWTLVLRLRQRGDRLRAALRDDDFEENDDA